LEISENGIGFNCRKCEPGNYNLNGSDRDCKLCPNKICPEILYENSEEFTLRLSNGSTVDNLSNPTQILTSFFDGSCLILDCKFSSIYSCSSIKSCSLTCQHANLANESYETDAFCKEGILEFLLSVFLQHLEIDIIFIYIRRV
jgi:hypothetical protein